MAAGDHVVTPSKVAQAWCRLAEPNSLSTPSAARSIRYSRGPDASRVRPRQSSCGSQHGRWLAEVVGRPVFETDRGAHPAPMPATATLTAPVVEAGGSRHGSDVPRGDDAPSAACPPLEDVLSDRECSEVDKEQVPALLGYLQKRTLEFSLDARGCRLVQAVLRAANDREQRCVVEEFRGEVRTIVESPHANHVIQTAIAFAKPSVMRFVLDEMLAWDEPAEIAKHQYGCRVLERIIEHFPFSWLTPVADGVLENLATLLWHNFGSYVVQHLLEHGSPAHRKSIVEKLSRDIAGVVGHQHAVGVLDKALTYATAEDQLMLAEKILDSSGLLVTMACQRLGVDATERLFMIVRGSRLDKARSQVRAGLAMLQTTRHGSALIPMLLPDFVEPPDTPTTPTTSWTRQRGLARVNNRAAMQQRRSRESARSRVLEQV